MEYEVVIGLEIHCELKTNTKIFCSCLNRFGGEPNTHCCPICIGHPGTLPKLNRQAIEYTAMAGVALNCEIQKYSKFDRKNYFYPDLPKAYQTSQFDFPTCKNGHIEFVSGNEKKRVRINRIHLEEDAGKLVHSEWGNGTLVDYNRGGVPLIEIVTEPDLRSTDDAVAFLETVRNILKYTGVSDCKMQEGSLRCDVNLSLRKFGAKEFGTRTEMKNLNSFKAAHRSMLYEIKRQSQILDEGGTVLQETRRWDDIKGKSFPMRSKEDAHDYRYFPEPDLVPVVLSQEEIKNIKTLVPELPVQKKERYISTLGLSEYDADVLTADKEVSIFFDEICSSYDNYKNVANWIMSEILRRLKEEKSEDTVIPVKGSDFAVLLKLQDAQIIGQAAVKTVLDRLWAGETDPEAIVEKLGLKQISDTSEIAALVCRIVEENPQPAADYRSGNTKAIAFFVGKIMKETKGKANAKIVNELLVAELNK